MAITARKLITKSLRRIGYLDVGGPLHAEDAADCLSTLNTFMHSWEARGLTYEHTDLTENDEVALDDSLIEGLKALLALRLTDDYAPEAETKQLRIDAQRGWNAIVAAYWEVPKAATDLPTTKSTAVY